jgi:Icc-related predicted phosphoesterase
MIVYATSDLHGHLPEIPECDLLLIAGDICPDFFQGSRRFGMIDKGEQRQRHWLDTDFREWLDKIPAKDVVAIAGNHDFIMEHKFLIPKGLRWHYLEDSEVTIGGLRIWGTPWVPNLSSWAFYQSDRGLAMRAELIPTGLDILIAHGPPYGVADTVHGMHVGETAMSRELIRIKPGVLVCGHIHEGFGEYSLDNVRVLNVACNDECYSPCRPLTRVM